MKDGSEEMRLAELAIEAVSESLNATAPRLETELAEHLEQWLLGLAMHLYWKLSGRSWDDHRLTHYYGHICNLALDAHHTRFSEFREDEDGDDPAIVFQDDIMLFYDYAHDVVSEVGERGLVSLHNVLREQDIWLNDWGPDDQILGSLASGMVFERALKDITS